MYAKCGTLERARQVLHELPIRDVFSWTALIAGYTQHGKPEEALDCINRMQCDGLFPDAATFACALQACGSIRASKKGEQIYDEIVKRRLLENNVVLSTAVVDMYAKCGLLQKARQVLYELPLRAVVCWNALMAGYVQYGKAKEALSCIYQMQHEGLSPDAVTFACALRACGTIRAAVEGEQIHEEIVKQRLLENNVVLQNALVDMYAKCGALGKARKVLLELPFRDVVSWNALIVGYTQQGKGEEALSCIEQMQCEGLSLDAVTFSCALGACGSMGALVQGERFHEEIVKNQLLGNDSVLATALVDMYAKCCAFEKARQVLRELPIQAVASWNALMTGYVQHGKGEEALSCIVQMQDEGLFPNAVTFACALRACSSIGAVNEGEWIHEEIVKQRLLESHIVLGNVLVDMYAKCGALEKAQKTLNELPIRDVVSWNALIAGYTQQGKSNEVMMSFDQMQLDGHAPSAVTFLYVLTACSYSGLLANGQDCFTKMSLKYGITPGVGHLSCMVDLFSRAGEFGKALALIESMPSREDLSVWHTLLGACGKWNNVEIGRLAFEHAVHMNEYDASAYVSLSNICVMAGMHGDMNEIEYMRVRSEAWKMPEHTQWVDGSGNVPSFLLDNCLYMQS